MTLPTGTISMSQVNVELGLSATTTISLNQSNVRALAGVPSGTISMSNLQGKSSNITINYMVAANGGTSNGAGGSGGQVFIGTQTLSTSTSYPVYVNFSGGMSQFNGVSANPGNNGGGYGGSGGSCPGFTSGGGGDSVTWPAIPFAPWTAGGYAAAGGGGAGVGGNGGNASDALPSGYYIYGGNGGPGILFIDGNYYGAGGGGSAYSVSNTDGNEPNAYNGSNGTGYGNFGSADSLGGVIISYVSSIQLYNGGTVTSTGTGATKRWYHTFSSSGTLAHM